MGKKVKPRNPVPDSLELWMAEVAMAFKEAEHFMKAPLLGAASSQKLEAWHLAPLMALGARGLVDNEKLLERSAEYAFSNFESNYGLDKADQVPPEIAFAFVYVGAHLGLGLIDEAQADRVLDVMEANPDTLATMIAHAAEMLSKDNPFALMGGGGERGGAPVASAAKPPRERPATARARKVGKPAAAEGAAGPIYTLEVALAWIEPRIWRRVQVPGNFNLLQLGDIIKIMFGWDGDHLDEFQIGSGRNSQEVPQEMSLMEAMPKKGAKLTYIYDFGDDWKHEIKVKAIGPPQPGAHYPVCEAGERAGPPEDCGGILGYSDILEQLKLPKRERDEERMEWLGKYNPDAFNLRAINARLKRLGKGK